MCLSFSLLPHQLDAQGLSICNASSVDMQGVSLSIVSNFDGCILFHFCTVFFKCRTIWHLMTPLSESKKWRCRTQSGAGIMGMLRHRTKMPECRFRRHRPRCRCQTTLISSLTLMAPPQLKLIFIIAFNSFIVFSFSQEKKYIWEFFI